MINKLQKIIFMGLLVFAVVFISGCLQEKSEQSIGAENSTKSAQTLESRLSELEIKVNELDEMNNYNGLMKQSTKNLIPLPPFRISVHFNKDRVYFFKENGELEITQDDPLPYKATYIIYSNNNTIMISPPKASSNIKFDNFNPYRLRLFDEYIVQTYENGWIDWVEHYDIKNN